MENSKKNSYPPKKKNAQMVQTAAISKNLHPAYSKKKKKFKREAKEKKKIGSVHSHKPMSRTLFLTPAHYFHNFEANCEPVLVQHHC